METALGIGERVWELGVLELRPSESVLIKTGCVLETCAFSGRSAIRAREALRIQNANRFFKDRTNHFYRSDEIGVSGDDDGGFVAVLKPIEKKVGGEVDIGTLFLGFEDLDGVWRGVHHGHSNDAFAEFTENDFEVWNRAESPPIKELPRGLLGIAGKLGHLRGEKLCLRNGIAGKCAGREFCGIEPSERRAPHGTVVKIKPIDVEDGIHGRDAFRRHGIEKLPLKNARATPEGAAPRPAVETNGRDVM